MSYSLPNSAPFHTPVVSAKSICCIIKDNSPHVSVRFQPAHRRHASVKHFCFFLLSLRHDLMQPLWVLFFFFVSDFSRCTLQVPPFRWSLRLKQTCDAVRRASTTIAFNIWLYVGAVCPDAALFLQLRKASRSSEADCVCFFCFHLRVCSKLLRPHRASRCSTSPSFSPTSLTFVFLSLPPFRPR